MNGNLSELQARDVVRRMHLLRMRLNSFAAHARTLRTMSGNKTGLDDRMLLDQANHLTRGLMDTFRQYQTAASRVGSLQRSLPTSGMAPMNPWRFEMRAASDQFLKALKGAEVEVVALQRTTITALNSPLRTPTMPGDPGIDTIVDLVLAFVDMVTKWMEKQEANRKISGK